MTLLTQLWDAQYFSLKAISTEYASPKNSSLLGMRNQKQTNWKIIRNLAIPCLLGFAIFLFFCGPRIINPTNLDWILATPGDPTQHYVGWNFFKHSPFAQWPLGLNEGYGEAIGSSIVFSDSIPLLALFFKLLRGMLPMDFQYFGAWLALCFILQALFAWKILSRYTSDTPLRLLGSALLCLTPAMLYRLFLGHEALVGHWLLLAGLYLYLRESRSVGIWMLLVAVAALIHAYLLAMVGAMWAASLVQEFRARRINALGVVLEAIAMLAVVLALTSAAGYFTVQDVTSGGFGYFRLNMMSPFHPYDIWSIFRSTPIVNGDYEGFAYPGAGVFLLTLVSVTLVIWKRNELQLNWRSNAPLIVLCVLFYVYALSNRIAFGSHEILQYTPPPPLDKLFAAFRSSGRFVWPVIYAIEIFLLFSVIRLCPKRIALVLLGCCVLLQTADLSKASIFLHRRWSHEWRDPLQSNFWKEVPLHYKHIAFVMPLDAQDAYGPIAYLASNNGMSVNGGYLARLDARKLDEVQRQLTNAMATGNYRNDTLYIFNKDAYWNTARQHYSGDGAVGIVDSYRVIAPGWSGCTKSCGIRADDIANIDMKDGAGSAPYLVHGWSLSEAGLGRWTDGPTALISVKLPPGEYSSVHVTMDLLAFVNARHSTQRVTVRSDGMVVAQWSINTSDRLTRQFDVPVRASKLSSDPLQIEFELPDATSPQSLELSDDARQLAINVRSIKIQANHVDLFWSDSQHDDSTSR
jgi:hypothetical protein